MLAERADDSYAIYSLLIPVLQETKKEYLISNTTEDPNRQATSQMPIARGKPPVTLVQQLAASGGGMILNVPDEWLIQFNEAVADYTSRKGERLRLEPKLRLPLPYRLVDGTLARKHKQPDLPSRMSEVYFDRSRSLGLVWGNIGSGCTHWYVFQKQDGQWRPAPWAPKAVCIWLPVLQPPSASAGGKRQP
jgi:hypothetical protein